MDDDRDLLFGLLHASPDGLWLIGLDGQTLFANERLGRILGRSPDELGDLTVFDAVSDDQGRADLDEHLRLMRQGHPGRDNEEVLINRPDGTEAWTLVSWTPMHDASGALLGYLHRLTEYTARRRLLVALQDREQQLADAQRIARLGSWTWDLEADRMWWSQECYTVFDLSPDRFGETWTWFLSLIHPDDRDSVASIVLTAIRQHDTFRWEARVPTSSGATRWVRGLGEVERDDDGTVVRLSGTNQDITDVRSADEAATEATLRLQLLQRMAEAANRSTTVADALVRAAHALDEHSGWRPVCVFVRTERGAPLSALKLPEPGDGLPVPDVEQAEQCWQASDVVIAPWADHPGHSVVTLPVLSGRGVACVIQLLADVSEPDVYTWSLMRQISDQLSRVAERERAAVQLAEARDEAMAASRHKSEFLATMSHEIRTPMNGVIGLNDLLLRSDLDDQQRRLADGVRSAGLTLLALINDILDLSKIESGRLELEVTEFDVRAVVDETAMILSGPAQDKGLELIVGCSPAVPRTLLGDPVRLGQVLTNLGSNAVKFTEAGEVVIDLTLDGLDGHAPGTVGLRVEVRDTGIGIDEPDLAGLFDAFTQADRSTTRQHGGTGLGLAISQRLVGSMGGTIGVRSAPGAGSRFWFTVPLAVGDPEHDLTLLAAQPLRRRRVLVIDDNPTAASFVVRQLTTWNLQAQLATSADEAMTALSVAAAEGTPYDLALVDLEMPDVDGLELGRRIRLDESVGDVVLVLIAAEGSVGPGELAAAGFRGRTTKPVRASELYDAMLDATTATSAPVVQPRHRAPTPPALGLRVLVVEDNAVNQLVATGLLENLGCRVVAVGNGAEAVDALAPGHDIDVVLMDCRMPRLDGFDATRAIRAREPDGTHVPIIAMTASALPGERDRCLDAGMDDFLTKPVDPVQLAQAVTRAGSGRRSAAAAEPATAATPGVVAVLDTERVELLSELVKDGVSFFERTRMSFLSRIDGSLAQISIAVEDGDAERTALDAHQLRGSALNLGLSRVGAAAAEIEERARTGDLAGMRGLVAVLRGAVAEGVEALAAVPHP